MNDQVLTAIRLTMTSLGVSLATKWGIDGSLVPAIISGLFALLTAGWSLYSRREAGLLISAAEVKNTTVITNPAMAAITPPHVLSNADVRVVAK